MLREHSTKVVSIAMKTRIESRDHPAMTLGTRHCNIRPEAEVIMSLGGSTNTPINGAARIRQRANGRSDQRLEELT